MFFSFQSRGLLIFSESTERISGVEVIWNQ
jgi:hypothetical protein